MDPPRNISEISGGEDLENLVVPDISNRGDVLAAMVAAFHERGFIKTECGGAGHSFRIRGKECFAIHRDGVVDGVPVAAEFACHV